MPAQNGANTMVTHTSMYTHARACTCVCIVRIIFIAYSTRVCGIGMYVVRAPSERSQHVPQGAFRLSKLEPDAPSKRNTKQGEVVLGPIKHECRNESG